MPPLNPLATDRTRLVGLRKKLQRLLAARLVKIKGQINTLLVTEDALGLSGGKLSSAWRLLDIPAKVEAFDSWLAVQLEANVLGENWWFPQILQGYSKGIERTYDDYRRTALALSDSARAEVSGGRKEFLKQVLRQGGGAKNTLSTNAMGDQLRDARGRWISQRAYELALRFERELRNLTTIMAQDLARILLDGLEQGLSAKQIAKEMSEKVDSITKNRAMVIARTELTRAHAEGQLDAMEALDVEQTVAQVEWVVGGNPCRQCEDMLGDNPYTLREARGLIPVHPNCMCSWQAVTSPKNRRPRRRAPKRRR